jgi:hypothetical protein
MPGTRIDLTACSSHGLHWRLAGQGTDWYEAEQRVFIREGGETHIYRDHAETVNEAGVGAGVLSWLRQVPLWR